MNDHVVTTTSNSAMFCRNSQHRWIDKKNINVLRINPQKHLDKAVVKVTIFYGAD